MAETFIRFHCVKCRKRLKAHAGDAGKKAHCSCGQKFEVPGVPQVTPEPSTDVVVQQTTPTVPDDFFENITEEKPKLYPVERVDHVYADVWDQQERNTSEDWSWVPITIKCVLAVAIPVALIILFVHANDDGKLAILIIGALVFAFGAVGVLVAQTRKTSVASGVGVTISSVLGFLLIIAIGFGTVLGAILIALGSAKWGSTLRPQNFCGNCGHSWFPRGTDYSPRCPNCGRRR